MTVPPVLPLPHKKQRLRRNVYIEATSGLKHLLSTLHERRCHRHMQDSLPVGWLAFTGRELNPLDCDERFPSTTSLPPFLDLCWRYCVIIPKGGCLWEIVFYTCRSFYVLLHSMNTLIVLGVWWCYV